MTWRAIESAPPGETVLVLSKWNRGGAHCYSVETVMQGGGVIPTNHNTPTHWQPLPPPPDAPAVPDEMVERAASVFVAAYGYSGSFTETMARVSEAMEAALLAALQPPDQ